LWASEAQLVLRTVTQQGHRQDTWQVHVGQSGG
jgi:hypothetical protein